MPRSRLPRRGDLTPRELAVLQMAAYGGTDDSIAGELKISPRTVAVHLDNIRGKLGATNRAHAVAIAFRAGLIG